LPGKVKADARHRGKARPYWFVHGSLALGTMGKGRMEAKGEAAL
jgi:hypothetical protein